MIYIGVYDIRITSEQRIEQWVAGRGPTNEAHSLVGFELGSIGQEVCVISGWI